MERRRIYYSFHDMPREPKVEIFTPYPDYREITNKSITSRTEIVHLVTAMLTLSVAFAFALGSGGILEDGLDSVISAINAFPVALFSILTGFFFHELSHKFVAQHYGLWAEFRMYPMGLVIALLLGVFSGFVFAAPGAVTIQGGARKFEMGRIATAGPLANIVVAAVALVGYYYLGIDSSIGQILGLICFINIFLGFFNLLPFGPLDGRKIISWNALVWAIVIIIAIIILTIYSTRMFIPGQNLL